VLLVAGIVVDDLIRLVGTNAAAAVLIALNDDNFLILGQGDLFGVPVSFLIFVALLLLASFVLRRTRFGVSTSSVTAGEKRRAVSGLALRAGIAGKEPSLQGDASKAFLAEPGTPPALEAVNLGKSFLEIRAVDAFDFVVRPGEVHAIVGENGAGKSTLIKMFFGVLKPDSGEIRIDGEKVVIDSVARGQDLGVAMIYQERAVVPELTVAQNIMLGYEPVTRIPGVIDRDALLRTAEAIWSRLGSPAPIGAVVRDLGPSVQQVVDIARALTVQARVVIMDELTATLTHEETKRLFQIIRSLKQRGAAIVYISHDLEEIFEVASRVTVLRGGELVGTLPVKDVDRPTLIRKMIGRDLDERARPFIHEGGEDILVVRDLRRGSTLQGVNLTVHEGEIVGVAGLVGSGRSELLRAIFGADRVDGGEMTLFGRPYAPGSPIEASASGVGFIPEDRKLEGLVPRVSISRNLALPSFRFVSDFGFWLDRGRERALAMDMVTASRSSRRCRAGRSAT
jgi:rhamnose transport system ATP-binding protein